MNNPSHDNTSGTGAGEGVLPQMSAGDPGRPAGLPPVPAHAERAHAKFSPSRLKALEICPGYADDPGADIHPVTAEGTLCHEALDSGDDSKLTDEQKALVAKCRELDGQFTECPIAYNELRLEIAGGMWGYVDRVRTVKDQSAAVLLDWKFGFNAQEDVETNPAAQAYVLGLFKRWSNCRVIRVFYVYPRLDQISTHTYFRSDMPKIETRIATIVARAEAGKERLVSDQCQYCGARATCATLHKAVLPIATRYATKHDLTLPEIPDFSLVKDPQTWSKLMTVAPVLEAMCDSIKRHALEFRQNTGQEIPGFEMRSRQGKKRILNPLLCWDVLAKAQVTQFQFLSAVDVSVPRLLDAISEEAPRGSKGKKAAEIEGLLRDKGVLEVGGESFFLAKSRKQ